MSNRDYSKRQRAENHFKMRAMHHPVNRAALLIGFSCRSLAQSVRRAGLDPWVIDCCGDLDMRRCATRSHQLDSLDNLQLLRETVHQWRSESEFDCVFFAGGTEYLSEALPLLDIGRHFVPFSRMRSWEMWARWAKSSGMDFPETHSIAAERTSEPFQLELQSIDTDAWVVKDHSHAGGLGVSRFAAAKSIETWARKRGREESREGFVLQRRIEGQGIGAAFLSGEKDAIALGGVTALPLHSHPWSDFIYRGSSGPIALRTSEWELLDAFAQHVTRETGWVGMWNADFIRTAEDRWVLLEINPRWSSGMELLDRNWEQSIAWHHATLLSTTGATISWEEQKRRIHRDRLHVAAPMTKEILYLEKPWKATDHASSAMWERRWDAPAFETTLGFFGDIPVAETELESGFPLCSLFVPSDDATSCCARSRQTKDWLQLELKIPIGFYD